MDAKGKVLEKAPLIARMKQGIYSAYVLMQVMVTSFVEPFLPTLIYDPQSSGNGGRPGTANPAATRGQAVGGSDAQNRPNGPRIRVFNQQGNFKEQACVDVLVVPFFVIPAAAFTPFCRLSTWSQLQLLLTCNPFDARPKNVDGCS